MGNTNNTNNNTNNSTTTTTNNTTSSGLLQMGAGLLLLLVCVASAVAAPAAENVLPSSSADCDLLQDSFVSLTSNASQPDIAAALRRIMHQSCHGARRADPLRGDPEPESVPVAFTRKYPPKIEPPDAHLLMRMLHESAAHRHSVPTLTPAPRHTTPGRRTRREDIEGEEEQANGGMDASQNSTSQEASTVAACEMSELLSTPPDSDIAGCGEVQVNLTRIQHLTVNFFPGCDLFYDEAALTRITQLPNLTHLVLDIGTNAGSCAQWFIQTRPWPHTLSLVLKNLRVQRIRVDQFMQFSNLEELVLDEGDVHILEQYVFRGLDNLRIMRILRMPIANFNFARLIDTADLEVLDVSYTNVSDIIIGTTLNQLHTLRFTHNRLVAIPDISFLPNVEIVDLSGNDIGVLRIPQSWEVNTKVVRLGLGENIIRTIDMASLSNVPTLTALNLSDNAVAALEEGTFDALPDLAMLDLSLNRMRTLPESLFQGVPSLMYLNLGSNQLKGLPAGIFRPLQSLQSLVLSRNFFPDVDFLSASPTLKVLDLSHNGINKIPFYPFPNLEFFAISQNNLAKLDHSVLQYPRLHFLSVESNRITSLAADTFASTTNLQILLIGANRLASVPATVFHVLTQLRTLSFFRNQLATLPRGVLSHLSSLRLLFLNTNRLQAINGEMLAHNPSLEFVHLSENRITTVAGNAFASNPLLRSIYLSNNRIDVLPPTLLDACSGLEIFHASGNRFGAHGPLQPLISSVPRLRELNITDVGLTSFPSLKHLPNLELAAIGRHSVPRFRLDDVLDPAVNTRLSTLAISSSLAQVTMLVPTDFVFPATLKDFRAFHTEWVFVDPPDESAKSAAQHAPRLRRQQDVAASIKAAFADSTNTIQRLVIGWPDFPSLHESGLCDALSPVVDSVIVTDSLATEFTLCEDSIFRSITLTAMPRLQRVVGSSELNSLHVAGNAAVEVIDLPAINVLDISGTNVPYSQLLCMVHGRELLFANNMRHLSYQDEDNLRLLLIDCLENVLVLDMSGNEWLSQHIDVVADALSTPYILTSQTDFLELTVPRPLLTRPDVPTFSLSTGPIRCLPVVSESLVVNRGVGLQTVETLFTFDCSCAAGFSHRNGRCVPTGISRDVVIAIAIGCVFGTLLFVAVAAAVRKFALQRRRQAELFHLVELKEQLIKEKDEEVVELKKAWEIKPWELSFSHVLGKGGQGEVWNAQWRDIAVAVKLWKSSSGGIDLDKNREFEKEIEFLRSARHQNLVRFFGAGVDESGSPFLVLELASYGSLAHVLETGKLAMLARRNKKIIMRFMRLRGGAGKGGTFRSLNGDASLVAGIGEGVLMATDSRDGEEAQAKKAASAERKASVSRLFEGDEALVWCLKCKFAKDIAAGMDFIHSKHRAHRDLKSGNVLVASNLVAMITDFGCIKDTLKVPRYGDSVPADVTSSSSGNRDSLVEESSVDGTALLLPPADAVLAPKNRRMTMTTMSGAGTPLYMAPEVLSMQPGLNLFYADVFSYGILLWELYMEEKPDLVERELGDVGGNHLEILYRLYREGVTLSFPEVDGGGEHREGASDDVLAEAKEKYEDISKLCMTFEPPQRPTFDEVLVSLEELLAGMN